MTQDNQTIAGLVRMIVICTDFLPRRMEEIPLDGHAAIIAENGYGKTSLIQLLPLFYGEEMRKLVSSSERKSFIEFYLPTDASYIAFEYRNLRGDLRSVVIHSDPQKKRLQYRFIPGPLTRDMFAIETAPGRIEFVKNSSFDTHLRRLSIDHAPRLIEATRHYRAIIQGRVDPTAPADDRVYFRRLLGEYALTDTRAPIPGIEQLLTQMLRNNVSMKTMLSLVALQAVQGVDGPIQILGNQRSGDIAGWPRDYAAYKRVMKHADEAVELSIKTENLAVLRAEMNDKYDILAAHLEEQQGLEASLSGKKEEERAAFRDAEEKLNDQISSLRGDIARLGSEIDVLKKRISEIDGAEKDFLGREAPEAERRAAGLPQLRLAEDLARNRLADLNRNGRDINEAHAVRRAEILSAHGAQRDRLTEARKVIEERLMTEEAAARLRADNACTALEGETRAALEEFDTEISRLREIHLDLVRAHAGLRPDPEAAARFDAISAALDRELHEEERASAAALQAREHEAKLRADHERAEMAHGRALAACEKADLAHLRALEDLDPKDGTLLAFLRKEFPDWGLDIGRVLRPDLLQRRDLSPARLSDDTQTLFGLGLDLQGLNAPESADRQALEQRVEEANAARLSAHAERQSVEDRLLQISADLKQARKASSEKTVCHQTTRDRLQRARNDQILAEAERARHLEDKGRGLVQQIADRAGQIEAREIARKSREGAGRKSLEDRRKHVQEEIASLRRRGEEDREAIDADIATVRQSEQDELAKNDSDRNAELLNRGTDPQSIRAVEMEIAALGRDIGLAVRAEDLARDWQSFRENRLPERDGLRGDVSARQHDRQIREAELAQAEIARKEHSLAHQRLIDEIEAGIDLARENCRDIESRLARAPRDLSPVAARKPGYEKGHRSAISDIGTLETTIQGLLDEIAAHVRKIVATFRRSESKIAAYVNDQSAQLGEYGPGWVPLIRNWFDHAHEDHKSALMAGIQAVAQPIRLAFHNLMDADRAIGAIGRKLSAAIRENAGFPHVRDVDIHLKSSIRTQPFWEDLAAFDEALGAWRRETGSIPPEEMVEALERLLGHWKDGDVPEVRLEDMLYIEGSMVERGNLRHFNRKTDLSDLSSNGNVMVLRLILFTGLISVMRQGRPIRMTWAVDEIGALDPKNTLSTLEMLAKNGISLLTAAPMLERSLRLHFTHYLRIERRQIYRLGETVETGIREWDADGNLRCPPATEDVPDQTPTEVEDMSEEIPA